MLIRNRIWLTVWVASVQLACAGPDAVESGPEPERRERPLPPQEAPSRSVSGVPMSGGGPVGQRPGGGGGRGSSVRDMVNRAAAISELDEGEGEDPVGLEAAELMLARLGGEHRAHATQVGQGDVEARCQALWQLMQADIEGEEAEPGDRPDRETFSALCPGISFDLLDCHARGESAERDPHCRELFQAEARAQREARRSGEAIRRGEHPGGAPANEDETPLAPEELAPEELHR